MSEYEREDAELAAMMGDKFIDATEPITETKAEEPCKKTREKKGPVTHHADVVEDLKARDAQWMPTKQRTFMDDLYDCTKTTLLFGGLNVLIWYWQEAGLMDESIALPSMIACAVLAGLGIGKVMGRK